MRPRAIDVHLIGARQTGNDRRMFKLAHILGQPRHGFEIARRGNREPGLDDVHTQPRQLAPDLKFLGQVQRCARRLLAIAQRGVEKQNAIMVYLDVAVAHCSNSSVLLKRRPVLA